MKYNSKSIRVKTVHELTWHIVINENRTTTNCLGYDVVWGESIAYSTYAKAKSRQKNMATRIISRKAIRFQPLIPNELNERLNLDISTIKAPKRVNVTITRPQWSIITNQRTQMNFSELKKKWHVESKMWNFIKWK